MGSLIAFFSRVFYRLLAAGDRRRRFALAVRWSRPLAPLLRSVPAYRKPVFSLDTDREHALSFLLNSMTFRGIEFDPATEVRGADEVLERAASGGLLLLTGHFYLNYLFCRWLYDRRIAMSSVMITERPVWCYTGTKVPFETIPPTKRALVHVKRRIAEGKIVTVAIDNYFPYENWRRVETARREIYMSENIIRFAVKNEIPIGFFATYMTPDERIVTELVAAPAGSVEAVFRAFDRFVDRHLAIRENEGRTH